MMTNFGFTPGIVDYWTLLSDWRNGSFAILLALGVLLIGYALATRNQIPVDKGAKPVEAAPPISTPSESSFLGDEGISGPNAGKTMPADFGRAGILLTARSEDRQGEAGIEVAAQVLAGHERLA